MSELHVLSPQNTRSGSSDRLQSDLEAMLDRALAQLEVIEREFATSREAIESSAYPRPWKDWRLAQLELRRKREREPLVQLVGHVHQRLRSSQFLSEAVSHCDTAGDTRRDALH